MQLNLEGSKEAFVFKIDEEEVPGVEGLSRKLQ